MSMSHESQSLHTKVLFPTPLSTKLQGRVEFGSYFLLRPPKWPPGAILLTPCGLSSLLYLLIRGVPITPCGNNTSSDCEMILIFHFRSNVSQG